jgi:DNA-directed RNA polymerase specialized sigma24 family protein
MSMNEPTDAEVNALIEQHPAGCTYEEIGDVLGVTKMRAQQIVNDAILKMLRAFRRRGVQRVDDLIDHRHYSHHSRDSLFG